MDTYNYQRLSDSREIGSKCAENIRALKSQPSQPSDTNQYRKKPVIVNAIQFDGTLSSLRDFPVPESKLYGKRLHIKTLEGTMTADPGDWIIKGVAAEFYPCKPEIFIQTYEPVQPSDSRTEFSDAEMLDWCEVYHADVTERKQGKWEVIWFSENESHRTELAYPSPREAIKAAMRAEREGS